MGQTVIIPADSLIKDGLFLFDLLSASLDDYLFMFDRENDIFKLSPKLLEEFDLPGEIIAHIDKYWFALIHPDDLFSVQKSLDKLDRGLTDEHDVEYRVKNRRGEYVWLRCRGKAIRGANNQIPLLAGIITLLGRKSKVDTTTGLLNKYQFELDVQELMSKHENASGAIVILGVDNFKSINETYNRSFGDAVLKAVGRKLETVLPRNAKLYRLDGDEFGILYESGGKEEVSEIFHSIQYYMNMQQVLGENNYFCTISAGAVLFPQDGSTYLSLHKHAEAVLELAKGNGKNTLCFFTLSVYLEMMNAVAMTDELRRSVEEKFAGFEVYFQPQVDAKTRRLYGAEALLRWRSPESGQCVSPLAFIPILEATKLIIPVGKWVLSEAVQAAKLWQQDFPDFKMSVNVSYIQFKEGSFKIFVRDCVAAAQLSPQSLILELTESCMATDLNFLNQEFAFLREAGFAIAMDDFGTGYSSLSCLKNLTTDIVKIDRAFVCTMLNSPFDQMLIEYTIKLCHSIGLQVCIEGTELKEEYTMIKAMDSDLIQGYLFGRPENKADFNRKFIINSENLDVNVS